MTTSPTSSSTCSPGKQDIKQDFSQRCSAWKDFRKRLNGGTVPPFKMHPGGTVPPFKMHPGGTVPPVKMHPGGTVPPFKMHPGGTLNFHELFFGGLNLDRGAKINVRSSRPFLNLSPLLLISLPPPPFQVGLDQMYASILILEGKCLHLKCTVSVGTIH